MTVQYYRRRKQVNGAYIDIVPDIARYAEGLADSTRAVMLANIVLKEEIDSSLLLSENRTIGSISQPVYLDKGRITACNDIPTISGANTFQNTNTFAGSLIVGSYNVGDKIKHFDDDIDHIYADMSNMVKKVGGGTQTISGSLVIGGMTVSNDGGITKLTNANGISVNGVYGSDLVTLNTAQTITGLKTFEITTDRFITARRNNPNFNARAISTDKPSDPTYDLFATLHYDVNSQEVVRDYTRIAKDYIISEKWGSFGDDNGVIHHPQIGINTRANGTTYAYVGGYSGTPPSNAIVYKGMMEATDGVTNNLVHNIGAETVHGVKTFDLDGYIKMVRHISGTSDAVTIKNDEINMNNPPSATKYSATFGFQDVNNVTVAKIYLRQTTNGKLAICSDIMNSDKTWRYQVVLAESER